MVVKKTFINWFCIELSRLWDLNTAKSVDTFYVVKISAIPRRKDLEEAILSFKMGNCISAVANVTFVN